jgi:hypothetical protein
VFLQLVLTCVRDPAVLRARRRCDSAGAANRQMPYSSIRERCLDVRLMRSRQQLRIFWKQDTFALSRIGSGNGLMEDMGFSHGNINIDLNGSLRKITPRLRGTCRPRTAVCKSIASSLESYIKSRPEVCTPLERTDLWLASRMSRRNCV